MQVRHLKTETGEHKTLAGESVGSAPHLDGGASAPAHPVGPLADRLDVGLVPLPRHAVDDLTVINEVAGDVSASDEGGLLPGQHHGVAHALQNSDAIGWSRRGCRRRLRLTPQSQSSEADVMGTRNYGELL